MTDPKPGIDLDALARPARVQARAPRRRWLAWAIPLAILLAFVAILASSLGDLLRGRVEVSVLRPAPLEVPAGATGGDSSVFFQAAGWAEPDPFPIQVSALAPGVVRAMLVQESMAVKAGDAVALLHDEAATIACAAAQATLAQARAERARAQAELEAAQANFENALAVTEGRKSAQAEAAGRAAESEKRAAAVQEGEARVRVAEQELAVQRELAQAKATGARQLELAQARLDEAKGALAGLQAEAAMALAERERALARAERAQSDFELRVEDKLRLASARAALDLAEGRVDEVQRMCEQAALRLERMTVRAPADGIVLERLAMPGSPLEAGESGAPVCTLYDPAQMRIRVDVPQGEVAKVRVGQKAEILAEARGSKPYAGEVIRVVQKADIQKVTLQVHVRVLESDGILRPEMLCQVRFLGSGSGAGTESSTAGAGASGQRVLIPSRLLLADSSVWVVDGSTRTAVKRRVEPGARHGEEVEILSGLNLSDKLIDRGRESLEEGAAVRVVEEP